jgi:hypothetical protein
MFERLKVCVLPTHLFFGIDAQARDQGLRSPVAAAGKIQAAAGADQNPDSDGTLRCTELIDSGYNANGALVFSDKGLASDRLIIDTVVSKYAASAPAVSRFGGIVLSQCAAARVSLDRRRHKYERQ